MNKLKLPLILILLFSSVAYAADSTTIETLELAATYESISIYANFDEDDNENNFASFEWRQSGGQWRPGMEMVVDRRTEFLMARTSTPKAAA